MSLTKTQLDQVHAIINFLDDYHADDLAPATEYDPVEALVAEFGISVFSATTYVQNWVTANGVPATLVKQYINTIENTVDNVAVAVSGHFNVSLRTAEELYNNFIVATV